jgi:hypothetical protein
MVGTAKADICRTDNQREAKRISLSLAGPLVDRPSVAQTHPTPMALAVHLCEEVSRLRLYGRTEVGV